MNAIILAAGNSSRMYAGGAVQHKAVLPIMNIPNIERTIIFLNLIDVQEIIIAVSQSNHDMDYLANKYNCKIIHIPNTVKNTLGTIGYLLKYINDTFIIEGDVVCAKNIFCRFDKSVYYVMKYENPEPDEWNIITDKNNRIRSFSIGTHNSPAIFGISFWSDKDCKVLINHLEQKIKNLPVDDPNIFWDNYIEEILSDINIQSYEISSNSSCEMNTYVEYEQANKLCLNNIFTFFDDVIFCLQNIDFRIQRSMDKSLNISFLKKLIFNTEKNTNLDLSNYEMWYAIDEMVYIILNNNRKVAFFSFVVEENFVLLRRLYVESDCRQIGIGKKIITYTYFYAKSLNKELRVNVYDKKAVTFYSQFNSTLLFETYCINLDI